MTGLTFVVALVVLTAAAGRISWGHALAVGAATPAGAALVVGTTAVPTFYAVALAVAGVLAVSVAGLGRSGGATRRVLPRGGVLLVAFTLWAVLVTLTAPLLFDRLVVVHPTTFQLVAGVLTTSNIAQITYLVLGVCVVVHLSRVRSTGPGILGLALGLCLVLAFARYLSLQFGLPFPEGFFDSSPTFNYIETEAGGGQRFRGIHAEPAALATTCIVGAAFFVASAARVHGARRAGCVALVAIAVWMGLESTSATFVVAGAALLGLMGLALLLRFATRRAKGTLAAGLAVCAGIVVVAAVAPDVVAFVESTIDDKVDSSSFESRSGADARSFGIFLDTYGWGVGLGAARASSFVPTILSSVGLVGSALLVAAVVTIIVSARHDATCRPVVWALVALFLVKVTSSPDLADSSGTLWLGLGILARSAERARSRRRPPVKEASAGPQSVTTRSDGGA